MPASLLQPGSQNAAAGTSRPRRGRGRPRARCAPSPGHPSFRVRGVRPVTLRPHPVTGHPAAAVTRHPSESRRPPSPSRGRIDRMTGPARSESPRQRPSLKRPPRRSRATCQAAGRRPGPAPSWPEPAWDFDRSIRRPRARAAARVDCRPRPRPRVSVCLFPPIPPYRIPPSPRGVRRRRRVRGPGGGALFVPEAPPAPRDARAARRGGEGSVRSQARAGASMVQGPAGTRALVGAGY